MKIGIISDTHDHRQNVFKAIEVFKRQKIDYLFHAGDIVAPFTASAFAEVGDVKFVAVFGNNDGEKLILKSAIEDFGGQIHEDNYKGEIAGKRIFMSHKPNVVDEVVQSKAYDLVIYGHTHKKDIRVVGDTVIVNPGECTDWFSSESFVAILQLDDMSIQEIPLT